MGKRGPAARPKDQLRNTRVNVYLSDDETRIVDERRATFGISRASYIRRSALDKIPAVIPTINREAFLNLSRVAANLNQHQTAINEGRANSTVPADVLTGLRDQVEMLRYSLVGLSAIDNDEGDDDESES